MSVLLSPRLNAIAGLVVIVVSTLWTVLSITLTAEPPNVLAMSGAALDLAGLGMLQNSLTMRKLEVETGGPSSAPPPA